MLAEDSVETLLLSGPDAQHHLLASLRLVHGNKATKKRMTICLHECCPCYNHLDGVNSMKRRLLQGVSGEVRESGWYFTDAGIDAVLGSLPLSKDAESAKDTSDDLANAFNDLVQNKLDDTGEKTSKAQIQHSLVIVKLDRDETKAAFRKDDMDYHDPDKDVDMDVQ